MAGRALPRLVVPAQAGTHLSSDGCTQKGTGFRMLGAAAVPNLGCARLRRHGSPLPRGRQIVRAINYSGLPRERERRALDRLRLGREIALELPLLLALGVFRVAPREIVHDLL